MNFLNPWATRRLQTLVSEKWGQKNPRTPGLVHLSDPIFLTTSAWAARFRLRSPFSANGPSQSGWPKKGEKRRKEEAENPAMSLSP
jgi:hypothetical protein